MKLFYAPQSPFARKVRTAAIELGLDDQIVLEYAEVVPGKPNEDFAQQFNPLRKIPALLTDAGDTIFDSTVICEYLDQLAGGGILIPRAYSARWQVLTQHAVAQGVCESVISVRYETWLRPEALRWDVWVDDQWNKINSGLKWFEDNQGALRTPVNIAHLALGSAIGYIDFRWPMIDWRARFPSLRKWFDEINQRQSFVLTRPENPQNSMGVRDARGVVSDADKA
jgi:glutathione S-transferase